MLDIHAAIILGSENIKACVTFARPDALKGTLGDSLKKVRPTGFFGVPRVWEKIHEKMTAAAATTTGAKKKIAVWAKSIVCSLFSLKENICFRVFYSLLSLAFVVVLIIFFF